MAGATDLGVTDPDHHGVRWVEQGLQPCTRGSAGRWPATSVATSTSNAGFLWDGGAVWAGRTRRKPIHGANGPACPHRPTSDRFRWLLVGVDLGRHGRSTPCVDEICQISKYIWGQIRFPAENGSDPESRSDRLRKPVEGGVGPVAGVSAAWMPRPSPHGGFTASPATGPAPPSHGKPAFAIAVASALAVDVASAGAGRSPAEHPRDGVSQMPATVRRTGQPWTRL